jgi:thiopeptide-type bacteriocin biosynthesis protein
VRGTPWQWVELDVGLVRHDGHALPSARVLFNRLEPLINKWRRDGSLRWFYFMRKPPDVRLRFSTSLRHAVAKELEELAALLQQEKTIGRAFFRRYRPESRRFGGRLAMEKVHAYFDGDTSMWLELDHCYQRGIQSLRPEVIVPAVLHDLFTRALIRDDAVLNVWRELATLRPLLTGDTVPVLGTLSFAELSNLSADPILSGYRGANAELASGLGNLPMKGRRLAQVLADVGLFTFHRHGFDGRRSATVIDAVLRSLQN